MKAPDTGSQNALKPQSMPGTFFTYLVGTFIFGLLMVLIAKSKKKTNKMQVFLASFLGVYIIDILFTLLIGFMATKMSTLDLEACCYYTIFPIESNGILLLIYAIFVKHIWIYMIFINLISGFFMLIAVGSGLDYVWGSAVIIVVNIKSYLYFRLIEKEFSDTNSG